jgi:hypothetical protein
MTDLPIYLATLVLAIIAWQMREYVGELKAVRASLNDLIAKYHGQTSACIEKHLNISERFDTIDDNIRDVKEEVKDQNRRINNFESNHHK